MTQQRYVTDETGKRVAVLLDIEEYEQILGKLEELDEIRAYEEAKSVDDTAIPFEQAVREIEQKRKPQTGAKSSQ